MSTILTRVDVRGERFPCAELRGLVLVLCLTFSASAQVSINEVQAGQRSTLRDSDGLPSDWLELKNLGADTVDLLGYYLSDDPARKPKRWRFPSTRVAPGAYLIVHCSGKQRAQSGRELHTNFRLDAAGGSVALINPDGVTLASRIDYPALATDHSLGFAESATARPLVTGVSTAQWRVLENDRELAGWKASEFDDAKWNTGVAAFQYSTEARPDPRFARNLATEVRGKATGVFLRIPFEVEDPGAFEALTFRFLAKGSFVAWLNGRELARKAFTGEPLWNSIGRGPEDEFEAEEISEGAVFALDRRLKPGKNLLAIHFLLETRYSEAGHVLPELTGFMMSGGARSQKLSVFDHPTPGWPNVSPELTELRRPKIEPEHGFFASELEVTLSTLEGEQAPIHFTLDGTDPSETSPRFTSPVRIVKTTELRARLIPKSERPGPVAVARYVKRATELDGFSSSLPILVITPFASTPDKVFAPAHIHALPPSSDDTPTQLGGSFDYTGFGGIKTRGSSTLKLAKKNYALELQNSRGDDVAAGLFGLPPDADWVLYGAYNFDESHIRNPLSFELARWLGLNAPRWRFVEVFLNQEHDELTRGDYIGLYVLMEKIEVGKHRVNIKKLDPSDDTAPAITGGYLLKIDRPGPGEKGFTAGGEKLQFVSPKEREVTEPQRLWIREHLDRLGASLQSPKSHGAERNYAAFIDVENFIDYHFLEEYVKNPDAYTLSTYMHLEREGRLRMGPVWDFDRVLRTNTATRWVGSAAETTGWTGDSNHGWWGHLFRDPEFRKRYRERGRRHLAETFRLERVFTEIDRLAASIREARVRDLARWPILGADVSENDLIALKRWITDRDQWFRSELLEAPELEASTGAWKPPCEVVIKHDNAEGTIYFTVDGSDPKLHDGSISPGGRIYERPIPISSPTWVRTRVKVGSLWTRHIEGHFTSEVLTVSINELMYNPGGGRDYEFIEIKNHGTQPLSLVGLTLSGAVTYAFDLSSKLSLEPLACAVIVNDRRAFTTRYDATQVDILGEYLGRLSNTEGRLEIRGRAHELLAEALYEDWHSETDGKGYSLVAAPNSATPSRRLDKASWVPSASEGGTPGADEK